MIIFRFRERKAIVEQHVELLAAIRGRNATAAGRSVKTQIEYIRHQFSAAKDWREKNRPAPSGAEASPKPARARKTA